MRDINQILFPVDFSERCKATRPFVKEFARRFQAKITLLHVLQTPSYLYMGLDAPYPITLDYDAMQSDAEDMLASSFEVPLHPSPVGISIVTDLGDPALRIVGYAKAHDIDLIMLPTHGYGGFRSLLLGSTAAKILHDAECPVWTSAHAESPGVLQHERLRSILCAVDLSEESRPLLKSSFDFATSLGATLRLVHAVPGAEPSEQMMPGFNFQHFLLQSARQQSATLQSEAGTNLEVCIAGGDVSKVVHAAAVHHEADLVIIGRGKMRETFGRLRTHSYSIIRDSPCPVLSL